MKRSLALGFVTLCLFSATRVGSQTGDLKCYKIKDTQQKTKYTADLGGLAAQPGCVIKMPAVMICTPAAKGIVPTRARVDRIASYRLG